MAVFRIGRLYSFEAAHFLPGHAKCGDLHGHSYRVEIVLSGRSLDGDGMLLDFGDLDQIVKPLIDRLDHQLLNSVGVLPQPPTAENIAQYLGEQVLKAIEGMEGKYIYLSKCRVWETARSYAEWWV